MRIVAFQCKRSPSRIVLKSFELILIPLAGTELKLFSWISIQAVIDRKCELVEACKFLA